MNQTNGSGRMWAVGMAAVAVMLLLGAAPARAQGINLSGMQLWNTEHWQTVKIGDFYGPNSDIRALKPLVLAGTRNGRFSGQVVVTCSTAPIVGLKVVMSDLVATNGGKIAADCVQIHYAELPQPGTSWCSPYRFDRWADKVPEEIATIDPRQFTLPGHEHWRATNPGPVASQPIWVTVCVPSNAAPGEYIGMLAISSELNKVPDVPVRITVADWALPHPRNFRSAIFGQCSPESLCRHYEVPRWSDKHFELMGQSLALMAEINSRQAIIDLCVDFYGLEGGPETMVRWIKQPDGTYKHDYTILDKYLDTVAKAIGKPTLLRVNCWGEWAISKCVAVMDTSSQDWKWSGASQVTLLDPATGKTEPMEQPGVGTPAFHAFWKPVLDEVRKKVEARGWWDVTALGHNSYCSAPHPQLIDAALALWPDGKFSYTAHNGTLGGRFRGTGKDVSMICFQADVIWGLGKLQPRGYQALLKPRPGYWCFTHRGWRCDWELASQRRIPEEEIMRGHDGVSDFGADIFPVTDARGRYLAVGNGRGTGGPNCSTLALLSPGPEGPTINARFEVIREGVQISEAILFIQKGINSGKLSTNVAARANAVLDERGKRMMDCWQLADKSGAKFFNTVLYLENAQERDNELFAVAAEVDKAVK